MSSSPIPTKALTSCVAYGLGDFTAQLFTVSIPAAVLHAVMRAATIFSYTEDCSMPPFFGLGSRYVHGAASH